ncbi:MAG: UDP-N-acetylmuramate--L-alanine ligase [Thermodesulfobacteriota bacterium]
MYVKNYHIFFVGIGGIGMSGIAELLLNLGYTVSGSDIRTSNITQRLADLGGTVFYQHDRNNIKGVDVVVVSSAIGPDNPEVEAARAGGVPVIPRAEMLAEIMRLKYSIVVAGAHGKTSTTSMIASVLEKGGLDPTVVVGGRLNSIGTNALLGKGDFIVAEADESDGSFLKFTPSIAVVTNIDREHLDYYDGLESIKRVFLEFINRIPFYGLAVVCLDNEPLQSLLPTIQKRCITYGTSQQADFQARQIKLGQGKACFSVYHFGDKLGDIVLNALGVHNVRNALAAVAVGMELDIPFERIKLALETRAGVHRRMEVKGEIRGAVIVDDYGHHPTEIQATLQAIRENWEDRRIRVVFQPHRYTRTRALFDEFTRSFYQCDDLVVLPVYPAGEKPIAGADGYALSEGIRAHGHKSVRYAEDRKIACNYLSETLREGDIVLTLGAGDVWKAGESLLSGTPEK